MKACAPVFTPAFTPRQPSRAPTPHWAPHGAVRSALDLLRADLQDAVQGVEGIGEVSLARSAMALDVAQGAHRPVVDPGIPRL